MTKYIVALDQGMTSSRAILFDRAGMIVELAQQTFPQIYPAPGLVEHDPEFIGLGRVKAMSIEQLLSLNYATNKERMKRVRRRVYWAWQACISSQEPCNRYHQLCASTISRN